MKNETTQFCRSLRKDQTDAEKLMWIYLRNRQVTNVKFRRQHPIDKYVLDFYAPSIQLAIELDGGQHYEEKGIKHDVKRNAYLKAQGVKILRFANNDVLGNLDSVYEVIEQEIEKRLPSTYPSPQRREGTYGNPLSFMERARG